MGKSASLVASAHIHVPMKTPTGYAYANAIDFALLPWNGGAILFIATPRDRPKLRLMHFVVLTLVSVLVATPVFRWTLAKVRHDAAACKIPHLQRTLLTFSCAFWIMVSWAVEAGPSIAWLCHFMFLGLGYLGWNWNHLGLGALPWHAKGTWGVHDDFHVLGAVADLWAFAYAVPAARAL